jgi:ribonuclease HI
MAKFYTDGASNQKTDSGYACIHNDAVIYGSSPLLYVIDVFINEAEVQFIYDGSRNTFKPTNNRGELAAILIAAKLIRQNNVIGACIVTDSKYCIGIYTAWLKNWKAKPALFVGKANLDLILLTDALLDGMNVEFIHQPAHVKNPTSRDEIMNALVDKYAVKARSASHNGIIEALA